MISISQVKTVPAGQNPQTLDFKSTESYPTYPVSGLQSTLEKGHNIQYEYIIPQSTRTSTGTLLKCNLGVQLDK